MKNETFLSGFHGAKNAFSGVVETNGFPIVVTAE